MCNPKIMFVLITFFTVSNSAFAVDATLKADRSAVDAACTQEAQTAGCGTEIVGKGLLKCIHAYKKNNKKTFTISPGCKTAMEQLHADKKAGK